MAGTIITVAQQKGGAGKTTLCTHLAVALAARGSRIALLDVDPQGSLGEWFERREQALGSAQTGLGFRTASGWGARRESRALAEDHDFVVVDTPANADREARTAMELAGLLIVPVQPTPADLWATGAILELAQQEKVNALLVLNRVPPRAKLTDTVVAAMSELTGKLATSRLGNRVIYAQSLGTGRTAPELRRSGAAAEEIAQLTEEVLRQLKPRKR